MAEAVMALRALLALMVNGGGDGTGGGGAEGKTQGAATTRPPWRATPTHRTAHSPHRRASQAASRSGWGTCAVETSGGVATTMISPEKESVRVPVPCYY
jgi:hypothetical protein